MASSKDEEEQRRLNGEEVTRESMLVVHKSTSGRLLQAATTAKESDHGGSDQSLPDDVIGSKESADRLPQASGDSFSVKRNVMASGKKWFKRPQIWRQKAKPPVPQEKEICPEYGAGWFSLFTFQWITPIISVGYRRPLEPNDIWSVNPDRSTDVLVEKLHAALQRRIKLDQKRPLLGAMYDTFKTEFIIGGLCQLLASILQSVAPFVLRYLINFASQAYAAQRSGQPGPAIGKGVGLVIGITTMQYLQSTATNHFMYLGMIVGGQARGVLVAVIFEKAMKLSKRAQAGSFAVPDAPPSNTVPGSQIEKRWYADLLRKAQKQADTQKKSAEIPGWSNGKITKLMATDTFRIDLASGFFHMIWCAPIAIILVAALLITNLTYSAIPGLALFLLSIPLLGRAVRSLFHRRIAISKATDQRLGLTQEVLQAIRFIKYLAWESKLLERLDAIRKREISGVKVLLAIQNGILAIGMSLPIFASMLSFITYSLSGHTLDPAPIFSSLALFNSLRLPLNFLPMVIGQVIDAHASIQRIQEFLLAEEAQEDVEWDYEGEHAIVLEGANFTWEHYSIQDSDSSSTTQPNNESPVQSLNDKQPFAINNLNFAIGRKELVAIIGNVGSGKSSVLAALAGDMRKTKGRVVLGGSRAFCPQYAWIQSTTFKENIVFGKNFHKDVYDKVLHACALQSDLDALPNGDSTEIGERGITVSGGQKQRINIARAIYFDADIVLMDDPLSAVDPHVGSHIMDTAICGLLKDKARILVTHQLHFLNRCDRIIMVDEGRITAFDTFDNLMSSNSEFQQLMTLTTAKERGKESDTADGEVKAEDTGKVGKHATDRPQIALMREEERAIDSISWDVWFSYVRAGGRIWIAPLVLLLLILSQGTNIATSLWISWWMSDKWGLVQGAYIGVYAALGAAQAILVFLFSIALSHFGTEASKTMLHQATSRILRAPMSFFDTTPLGRITNRFSKDIDVMDNTLTDAIRMYFMTLAIIGSVFILVIAYYYYYAVALGPLLALFLFSAAYYRASAREIKRHESVLRSVFFARFSEAILGTSTIRAYGLQGLFSSTVRKAIDDMNGAYYLTFANQRWLSTRLDIVGILLVFTTGILVVTSRFSVTPSIAGLVLSYILTIVQMIQFTVRQLAEVENNMNATERVHYYGTMLEEEEAPNIQKEEVRSTWPEHGAIVFQDVQMRYRDGLPLVLKNFNISVTPGERIGIIGRTGAGKSSILSTLFRIVELSSGTITIDGIDIATIRLHDLRSRLAIIPQDPTLFKGTVRSNLDPFNKHEDLELWSALRQADLAPDDSSLDGDPTRINLDSAVEEEGLNFSLGQRQLMALARALVRGSQIVVCDEATSSVDFETDQRIQKTILSGFKGKTLLCIAHRLKTIIGYDRICVMDAGSVAELGSPLQLYDQGGMFTEMCEHSRISREDFL